MSMRVANRPLASAIVLLFAWAGSGGGPAYAIPPAPPPPEVIARYRADCATPPRETIPLTRTGAAIPSAPPSLKLGWALRIDAPPGVRLGSVVGLARLPFGEIVAATDAGYWIRVPVPQEGLAPIIRAPVAISIRDLPGRPVSMAMGSSSTGPYRTGGSVYLAVKGGTSLFEYELRECWPGAPPRTGWPVPAGAEVLRLEPTLSSVSNVVLKESDGDVVTVELSASTWNPSRRALAASGSVAMATASARILLARGCDELTFLRKADATLVRTSCTPSYLPELAKAWEGPYKTYRDPAPIPHLHTVGKIAAPIVAVSNGTHNPGQAPARGGGVPCGFLLAAQARADAPIFIYGVASRCATYSQGDGAAPPPRPPPP